MLRYNPLASAVIRYARAASSGRGLNKPFKNNSLKTAAKCETTFPPKSFIATWLTWAPVAWLIKNSLSIACYQLVLEGTFTVFCAWLLIRGHATPMGMKQRLESLYYPFTSFVSWDGGHHDTGFTITRFHVSAEALSAIHTSHNIASGLLPLQLVVLGLTYPAAMRVWVRASSRLGALWPLSATSEKVTNYPFGKGKNY
ncbi:unnamed protein product, partial [Trypanosoma congolense IL3000]